MSITVNEYLEDKAKLERYYIPFNHKMEIVDILLEQLTNTETVPPTIDTATLKYITTQLIIEHVTNIELGDDGYDILCEAEELTSLLQEIAPEVATFNDIINDKLQDFYRYEYSESKVINDIKVALNDYLSDSLWRVEEVIKDLDVEKLVNSLPLNGTGGTTQ